MSTLKLENIQHPESSTPAISLDSNGGMTGSFPYPNRNLIINGDMRIAQRGNQSGMAENSYAVDRFRTRTYGGNGRFSSTTLSTDVPSGTNFVYSTKWEVETAATDVGAYGYSIEQLVEGYNSIHVGWGTSSSKKLTLSFWVKVSESGTYVTGLRTADAIYSDHREITLTANTWTKVEESFEPITQDLSAASSTRLTNGIGIVVDVIGLAAQTSKTSNTTGQWISGNYVWTSNQTNWMATVGNTVYITGVQLEIGEVVTEFEFKSYGQELAECQRYFQKHGGNVTNERLGPVFILSGTGGYAIITNKRTMRANPVSSFSGSIAVAQPGVVGATVSAISDSTMGPDVAEVGLTFASTAAFTQGEIGWLTASSTSSWVNLSAEL